MNDPRIAASRFRAVELRALVRQDIEASRSESAPERVKYLVAEGRKRRDARSLARRTAARVAAAQLPQQGSLLCGSSAAWRH